MDLERLRQSYQQLMNDATPVPSRVELGKVLLAEIRLSGRSVNIFQEREQIAQMGRSVGELLYQLTNVYYPVRLEPLDIPAPQEVASISLTLPTSLILPTNEIPEPGDLPPHSWLPYADNPDFVGRTDELRQLAEWLQAGETAAVVSVNGIGGLGKSQLAIAFAHRYGRFFAGGVYWISLADPAGVVAELAKCARMMNPAWMNLPLEQQGILVRQAWQEPVPRLLIFDNCEADGLLAAWKPATGGCRVLVTSRKGGWDDSLGVQALALHALPRAQSIALVQKLAPHVNQVDARVLAQELGDLPLALHLASKVLKRYESVMTAAQYIAQLQDKGLLAQLGFQATKAGLNPTGHDWDVARTFALSYEQLFDENAKGEHGDEAQAETSLAPRAFASETDALAHELLLRAAFFAPGEPIPRDLLVLTVRNPAENVATEPADGTMEPARSVADPASGQPPTANGLLDWQMALEDALVRLVNLGLVEAGETGQNPSALDPQPSTLAVPSYKIHRLVTLFVQRVAGADAARQEVEKAILGEASRLNKAGYPAPLLAWQSHLRHVADESIKSEQELADDLSNELGYHLQAIGEYADARPYYERALAIREKALAPEHPDTATSLNNLGFLLKAMGEYAVARPIYERALAIREKTLGPAHPDTATSLNNLGFLLDAMGDYAAARPYYERALAITEKALGPAHPDTATSLNNLGFLLKAMGDYPAARPYLERALAINEKALGPEHPDTALSLNNLGFLLNSIGDYAAARPYYERALAIREKALGPDHPDTATSLNNLGFLLDSMGDYEAARPYFERALAIREKALGPEHPDTAGSLNNLGALLDSMGDYEAARPYYERALAITEKALGPAHPDTALSLNNLGTLCFYEGDLSVAADYLRQALAIWEKQFGPNHPNTQTTRENLAFVEAQL